MGRGHDGLDGAFGEFGCQKGPGRGVAGPPQEGAAGQAREAVAAAQDGARIEQPQLGGEPAEGVSPPLEAERERLAEAVGQHGEAPGGGRGAGVEGGAGAAEGGVGAAAHAVG